jgi:hypothetical protein
VTLNRNESESEAGSNKQFWVNQWRDNSFSGVQTTDFRDLEVLTATSIKMVVSWDVTLRSLVNSDHRFGVGYCLVHLV